MAIAIPAILVSPPLSIKQIVIIYSKVKYGMVSFDLIVTNLISQFLKKEKNSSKIFN